LGLCGELGLDEGYYWTLLKKSDKSLKLLKARVAFPRFCGTFVEGRPPKRKVSP
jgi:hypothetical protein